MCCSTHKGSRTYQYTDVSSPWNNRFLITLWVTEIVFGVFVCVFGGACLPFKNEDHRYDDGISNAMYQVLLFLTAGVVWLNLGFILVQYLWFRQNKLHPGFMVFMESFVVLLWVTIVGLTLWTMIEWAPKWQIYEVVELMYIFNGVPYLVHLWYASVVYHRLKKSRRRGVDVEIEAQ